MTAKKKAKPTDNEPFISRGNLKRLDFKTRRAWGRRLGDLIASKEVSYADVARDLFGTMDDGVSAKGRDRMSKYVSGKSFPDNETIGAFAAYFEMTARELLGPDIVSRLETVETDPIVLMLYDNGTCTAKFSGSGKYDMLIDVIAVLRKHGNDLKVKTVNKR